MIDRNPAGRRRLAEGVGALTRRILPFFVVEVVVLVITTLVPQTVTWLPRLLGL